MVLRPTQVRFGKGWILTGWFRVCWKRDGEKNEDRNCISGVGERQKREYQKHVRRVCSVGKTEKEGVVVKGKEVEEVESEEWRWGIGKPCFVRGELLQCWTELEKWIRREFVVDDAGEREQWKQTTDSKNVDEVTNATTTADVHFVSRFKSHTTKPSSRPSTTCLHWTQQSTTTTAVLVPPQKCF